MCLGKSLGTEDGQVAVDGHPVDLHIIGSNVNDAGQQPALHYHCLRADIPRTVAVKDGAGFHNDEGGVGAIVLGWTFNGGR